MTDPTVAAGRGEDLYNALARSGLVDSLKPSPVIPLTRPSREDLAAAAASLQGGPLASDLIRQERDEDVPGRAGR